MEDKSEIVKAFLPVLQMTDFFKDLLNLEYNINTEGKFKNETVTATFYNGCTKEVNVTYDSGFAMLQDIVKQLY